MAIMTGEEIPLLGTQHDHIYDRFSPRQKRFLVAIVSWGGLVACMFGYWRIRISTECFAVFCSGTFVPSIPQIAQDFNSTGEVIRYMISFISDTNIRTLWFSYAVSVYILAASCGGLIGSVYSKFCEHEYIISDL